MYKKKRLDGNIARADDNHSAGDNHSADDNHSHTRPDKKEDTTMSDKITPFPGSNNIENLDNHNPSDLSSMAEQLSSIFASLPQNALMHEANTLILQKAARTIIYLQITGRVSEVIKNIGFDPDDFKPDKDTFEDFLIMDPEDYPEDEMHDPDNVFNGPVYDWRDGDRVYRIATTIGFDEDGDMSSVYITLLKLERGAER